MKNFRSLILILSLGGALFLLACGDGNVIIDPDPSIQRAEDIEVIEDYLIINGIVPDNVDTTESGVRYIIINEGTGTDIDESDVVTFNYTGKLTNDSIFDTSIQAVGDSIRNVENIPDRFVSAFDEDRVYNPFEITYTSSGWPITGQFIPGFIDGISSTFNKLNVGGSSLILIPSELAYSTSGFGSLIPPNSVLIFELYPISVIKQPPLEED